MYGVRGANSQEKGQPARLATYDATDWAGTSQSLSTPRTIAPAITRACHAAKKPITNGDGARSKARRREALGPFNVLLGQRECPIQPVPLGG
jgi:hypothetical protein